MIDDLSFPTKILQLYLLLFYNILIIKYDILQCTTVLINFLNKKSSQS